MVGPSYPAQSVLLDLRIVAEPTFPRADNSARQPTLLLNNSNGTTPIAGLSTSLPTARSICTADLQNSIPPRRTSRFPPAQLICRVLVVPKSWAPALWF